MCACAIYLSVLLKKKILNTQHNRYKVICVHEMKQKFRFNVFELDLYKL